MKIISLILIICLLFSSCGGEIVSYAEGTLVSVDLGHSVVLSDDALPSDEVAAALGELKPVWREAAKELGIEIADFRDTGTGFADLMLVELEAVDGLTRSESIINLYEYSDRLPNLFDYLARNTDLRSEIAYGGNRKMIYCAPCVRVGDIYETLVLMDGDTVRALLDGDGEYTACGESTLPTLFYTPLMPTDGTVEVTVTDSNGASVGLVKNYSAAGNVIATMNTVASTRSLSVREAVNMLRDYIDDAYSGYYGSERSRLFLGQDAAFDTDELVALMRCIAAIERIENVEKLDTGATLNEKLDFIFGNSSGLAGNAIVAEGLDGLRGVTLGELDAVCGLGYSVCLPPLIPSYSYDGDQPCLTLTRAVTAKSVSTGYGLVIPKDLESSGGDRLYATLALIDYAYSDEGRALFGGVPVEMLSSVGESELVALVRDSGLKCSDFAKNVLGSCIAFTECAELYLVLSGDAARRGVEQISLAIRSGTVKLRR